MLSESYYERIFSVIGNRQFEKLVHQAKKASLMKGFEKLFKQKRWGLR